MEKCVIGANSVIERCIIDENTVVSANVIMGRGENIPNQDKPKIYDTGITVVGEDSFIPEGVTIGKNCVIYGKTTHLDYEDHILESGKSIILDKEVIV
jgi:glucose-1-phosphate adenylyltransferase